MDFGKFDVRDESGIRIVSACADVVFYFESSYDKFSAGLQYALACFLAICPAERLTWYRLYSMDEHKAVTDRTLPMLKGWLKPDAKVRDHIGIELNDASHPEATPDHAFDMHVMSRGSENFDDFAGYLRLTFPASFLEGDDRRFRELVADIAAGLPFVSGHAGYCLNVTDYGELESFAAALPLAMRHPGFDIATVNDTAYDLKGGFIKGVNWLTLLSSPLLKKVGGQKALGADAESAGLSLSKVGAGYMLQAGQHPVTGDRNRGQDVPAYRAMMRVLQLLMADVYSCLSLPSEEAPEQTQAWFRRLLD
jgi:Protein of unknown function (DUF3396)